MLKKSVTVKILFFLSVFGSVLGQEAFRVEMLPQEAYVDEAVSFGFSGTKGTKVTAYLNEKRIAAATFETERLEFNLAFKKSGVIRFTDGNGSMSFRLVLPTEKTKLKVKEGIFYVGTTPAILLLHHRHPPKKDRRWQVALLFDSIFSDYRDEIKSAFVAGFQDIDKDYLKRLDTASGKKRFWRTTENGSCIYELDRIITAEDIEGEADVLLLWLSENDLRRGMRQLRFRMRMEWILQRHTQFKQVFVTSIALSDQMREMCADANRHVRLAAEGNGAVFLDVPPDEGRLERFEKIVERMQAEVKF